jgi:UDP-3-O-[3-hydroxymyristoyl] N-acetylglucosamine deacetylase / 3-hydroxyacyl-[acyl-carrier-protein] dehydratase
MAKQRTIGKECIYSGIGLHTGSKTTIKFKPAPEDYGVRFVRIDMPNNPEIIANINNVVGVTRGTTLANGEARVHTVEHIMASFHALGIDNVIVEIDANEPPVADGSAFPFVEILKEAGIIEQTKEKEYITIKEPIKFQDKDAELIILPSDEFKISCTISYNHPILETQFLSFTLAEDAFCNEIAPARTFCFDYEIECMQREGLAKGGSLDNAIVIGATKIHNKTNLRFKDEFVRHKILDLIGDLFLLGKPIKGHVIAVKCGHSVNVEFATKILEVLNTSKKENISISNTENVKKYEGKLLNVNDIMAIIPHRHPFLLIDRAILTDETKSAIGFKNLTINEAFFQGHYPGNPIMPGVLIIEAMAQTACLIFLSRSGLSETKIPLFMGINEVKFRKPVVPGDRLRLEVEVTRARERGGKLEGKAYVEDMLVAEAEIMFSLIDK